MKQGIVVALCCLGAFFLGMYIMRPQPAAQRVEPTAARPEAATVAQTDEPVGSALPATPVLAPAVRSFDERFHLPVLRNGEICSISLHDYVLGALLGEMPTSFPAEARKAQAVAIRTYTLRQYTHRKHGAAAVCTDPGCCMNWVDPAIFAAQNGEAALRTAEQAVAQTDGEAIYYDGALITATFFSASGGRTEDASAVWGGELPYLHAVDSPDEHTPYDTEQLRIDTAAFTQTLLAANEMAVFPAHADWLGPISHTNGGGVDTVELGGCVYTGVQLRRLFGLRSTCFELEITDGEAVFTTHGFGHRVGLSQYGAKAMAEQGRDYVEILSHYYRGVEIRQDG